MLSQQAAVVLQGLRQDQVQGNTDLGQVLMGALQLLSNSRDSSVEVVGVTTAALGVSTQGVEGSTPPIASWAQTSRSIPWAPLAGYYWYMVNSSATVLGPAGQGHPAAVVPGAGDRGGGGGGPGSVSVFLLGALSGPAGTGTAGTRTQVR